MVAPRGVSRRRATGTARTFDRRDFTESRASRSTKLSECSVKAYPLPGQLGRSGERVSGLRCGNSETDVVGRS